MSRSIRGSKGCGYDYWSRRPNNYGSIGKESKRIIHGIERQLSKQIVRRELKELE